MNSTALSKFLKEHCLPHNDVEVQPGLLTDYGFDPRLSETEYYGLYSFFFYRNEWVERIFDHYQLVDKDYGEELIRVNEDGFRLRMTKQNLAVGSLKFNGKQPSNDFFVRVSRKLPSDAKLLKNAYFEGRFLRHKHPEIRRRRSDTQVYRHVLDHLQQKDQLEIFDGNVQHTYPAEGDAHDFLRSLPNSCNIGTLAQTTSP